MEFKKKLKFKFGNPMCKVDDWQSLHFTVSFFFRCMRPWKCLQATGRTAAAFLIDLLLLLYPPFFPLLFLFTAPPPIMPPQLDSTRPAVKFSLVKDAVYRSERLLFLGKVTQLVGLCWLLSESCRGSGAGHWATNLLPPTPDVTQRPDDRFLINSEESASLFHLVIRRCALITSNDEELLCFS